MRIRRKLVSTYWRKFFGKRLQQNPNLKNHRDEIKEIKKLNKKKAIGPNGVSGYILKECRQEMTEPIHDIIECSLRTS